jgi:hypothetical protein
MNAGIIKNFKSYYRKILVKFLIDLIDLNKCDDISKPIGKELQAIEFLIE